MDSTIPPINSINLNLPVSDKVVNGEIEALPANITGINSGESLLLKVLLSPDTNLPDSAVTSLKVSLPQINNSQPAEIKLDTPLRLPAEENIQIAVKIQSVLPEKVEVKLISINNEVPAKFVASPSVPLQTERQPAPNQTAALPQKPEPLPAAAEKTLIVETGTAAKNVVFHPLDVSQVIENIAKPLNLPDNALTQIAKVLQGVKINISLDNFVAEEIPAGKTVVANPDYAMLPKLDKPVQAMIERLRPVLHDFAKRITSENEMPEQIRQLADQIKNEILPFKGKPLSGEAISSPDNRLLAFKTVLGNVLPEPVLKAENGAKAILEIKSVFFPEPDMRTDLESLFSTVRLIGEAKGLPLPVPAGNKPEILPSGHSITSLIEPLKAPEHQNLSTKVIEKLPAFDNKMLSNTVNFIKGAVTNNIEAWLGKEILSELKSAGVEGQEVAARLENMMSVSVREGVSWRMVEIPLFGGETVNKIRIAVKKPDDENERRRNEGKDKGGTRFVVDTSFSQLGAFQFDGFSLVKDRRFDLVIRTSKEVGNDLYANILRLFKTTLSDLGYNGNVKINVKENFIKICEDDKYGETLKKGIYI